MWAKVYKNKNLIAKEYLKNVMFLGLLYDCAGFQCNGLILMMHSISIDELKVVQVSSSFILNIFNKINFKLYVYLYFWNDTYNFK